MFSSEVVGAAGRAGDLVGYARVSTRDQHLDRHIKVLTEVGCVKVFTEKASGRNTDRPKLTECLEYMRPSDTLVVPSLDRLSRSFQDLIGIVAGLGREGMKFRSLHEALDTSTPQGEFQMHVFAALAEFIRKLIVQGTRDGLDAARARGVRLGRPPAMTAEQIRQAKSLLTNPEETVSSIARLLGVSRATIYKYVPELAEGRSAITSTPVPVLESGAR